MKSFCQREKERLADLKSHRAPATDYVAIPTGESALARVEKTRDTQHLFDAYKLGAIDYFTRRCIRWHSLDNAISSQTCCVNFWFIFTHHAEHLGKVLRDLGYPVAEVLEFELDSIPSLRSNGWNVNNHAPTLVADSAEPGGCGFVAFEWIGAKNYLGELRGRAIASDAGRNRGQNFTSVDAAIRFRRTDGQIQIVLIEWKYTEKYRIGLNLRFSQRGTDRLNRIYANSLEAANCQIVLGNVPAEALFYDPFYQMMRNQLLASAMGREGEMGAAVVSTLHILPRANSELLQRITSPYLVKRGTN